MNRLLALGFRCFALCILSSAQAQNPGAVDADFDPNVTGFPGSPQLFVTALAVQPDAKIIIGGTFDSVGGVGRSGIARLNPDGTVDPTFDPGAGTSYVYGAAVQPDGKILIFGDFNSVDGQTRREIARLHSDGRLESSATFNLTSATGGGILFYCMALQKDGKILVGGAFITLNGVSRARIARLNNNGTVDTTFNPGSGANTDVTSIAVQADGKILIAGRFTTVNGQTRRGLARLNANGSLDTSFNPVPDPTMAHAIFNIAVQRDAKIVAVGEFTSFAGGLRNRVGRLNPDGTFDSTFDPGSGADAGVYDVLIQADGKILISGSFSEINGEARPGLASLNADGSLDRTFDPGFGSSTEVQFALQPDGKLILGGNFENINGVPRHLVARLLNDPAEQTLQVASSAQVGWLRSGSGPEVEQVMFDLSTDEGATWALLGHGLRTTGGWNVSDLTLPEKGLIRARGRSVGGENNGSSGLVQQIVAFDFFTASRR